MKQSDDESIHSVPFDPVRDSLLSATKADWDWLEEALKGVNNQHSRGWRATLREVREGLNHAAPKPIPGYPQLSPAVIASIVRIKEMEERWLRLCDEFQNLPSIDHRLLAVAKTQMELGYMALVKAFARPERVKLPGDQ